MRKNLVVVKPLLLGTSNYSPQSKFDCSLGTTTLNIAEDGVSKDKPDLTPMLWAVLKKKLKALHNYYITIFTST